MHLTTITLLLPFFSLATARSCTDSDALSWPPDYTPAGGSGGSGTCEPACPTCSIVDACATCCGNDQDCLQACLEAGGLGRRGARAEGSDKIAYLHARADLTCSSSEDCYVYTDGSLLCFDPSNGLYHDDVGGTGDYNTGEYTSPGGVVQTGTSAPESTAVASASATRSTATSSTTDEATDGTTSARITSTGTGTGTSDAAATATTTSLSGVAGRPHAGAALGAVGFIAALVV